LRRSIVIVAAALACAAFTASAHAVATNPFQVAMWNLDNPRGLAWGPEGALYVAEAGIAGRQPCFSPRVGLPVFAGPTGAVSRLWHGVQERVVTGLPSYSTDEFDGSFARGPNDIGFVGRGNARVTIGLQADPALRATCGSLGQVFGTLVRTSPNGPWRLDADLAAYEAAKNPDRGPVESNPYGLLAEPGGTIVADAAGNDLLRVAANGSISTLAVFPSRSNSSRGMDSVPTSVVVGPDGAYYVGEFADVANVWRVVPGRAPTVFRSGFTHIIDITFGPDGSLYVLDFGETVPWGPGRLWRVAPNGVRSLVAIGFVAPGGVTIGPDGAFYVSNCSIFRGVGDLPCVGTVVRIPPQ
jgi:hypothetical protein